MRCLLQIEVVQRNNAVDPGGSAQVANRQQGVMEIPLVTDIRHVEDLVDARGGPFGFILERLRGQEQYPATEPFRLFQKAMPLLVAGEAEKRQWFVRLWMH